nr:sulfurtransferase TusA family protein [Candidatus Freyarchaeota archaeon]
MNGDQSVNKVLDARGLKCPLPIVKTKKEIDEMNSGEVLKVLATDPGSKGDFASWCKKTGNKLLEAFESDGVFTYIIKKKGRETVAGSFDSLV